LHFLFEVYIQIEREKIMNFIIKSTRFFIIDLLILINTGRKELIIFADCKKKTILRENENGLNYLKSLMCQFE